VQMLVDLLSGHDGFVEGYVHRDDWKDASQHWIDAFDPRVKKSEAAHLNGPKGRYTPTIG
jgi:hypothetical protein